jgi:hypothetical protein
LKNLPVCEIFSAKNVPFAGASLFRRSDVSAHHIIHEGNVAASMDVEGDKSACHRPDKITAVEMNIARADDDCGINYHCIQSLFDTPLDLQLSLVL